MGFSYGKLVLSFLAFLLLSCDKQTPSFVEESVVESTNATAEEPGKLPGNLESMEKSFVFNSKQESEMQVSVADGNVEILFDMDQNKMTQSVSYTQESREKILDSFSLSATSAFGSETFEQTNMASSNLDILLVVDNSRSMTEEQQNLSTKLSALLEFVEDSDWRISVETTDPSDPCGQHIISKGDANVEEAFASAVQRGIDGTGNEQGILQAVNGLTCNGGSWLRSDSTLAVLIISDENNCSNGERCEGQPWENASYLTDYLNRIRAVGTNARVYGLIWHPSDLSCDGALRMGSIYSEAIDATNGTSGSICDSDYSATLKSVSENIGMLLATQFSLKFPATPGSVAVTIDGKDFSEGFSTEKNVVVFDKAPENGSVIKVEYRYETAKPGTKFALSKRGPLDDFVVYLDNTEIVENAYSVHKEDGIVEFSALQQGGEIKVLYRLGVLENKSFALNLQDGLEVSDIRVFNNDEPVAREAFSFDGKNVHFQNPPRDAAKIKIEYDILTDKRLSYPVFIPENALDSLKVTDKNTLEEIDYTLEDGLITFAEEDYILGRKIALNYQNRTESDFILDAGFTILDSHHITMEDENASVCSENLVFEGSMIDFSQCGFENPLALKVRFLYQEIEIPRYQILENIPSELLGKLNFTVTVNGVEDFSYQVFYENDLSIGFEELPEYAKIVVKVSASQ